MNQATAGSFSVYRSNEELASNQGSSSAVGIGVADSAFKAPPANVSLNSANGNYND